MEHLDEGTVHAWLDGALAPEEGDRIERHLAECADCSGVVAEARGLIAASTRILGALDDVPAVRDLAPAAAGARDASAATTATSATPGTTNVASARRRTAWPGGRYSAAAAIALIALGSAVVVKGRGGAGAGDFAAPSMAPMAPMAERAAEATAPDSAGRAPTAVAPLADVAAPSAARPADGSAAASQRAGRESKGRDAAASANEGLRRPQPAAPLPPPPLAPPRVAARALSDSVASALETREEGALRKAYPDVAQRGSDSARAAKAQSLSPALRAEDIAKRERERVLTEPRVARLDAVVTTGTGAAAPRGGRSVEELAACWVLERTTAAREGGVPERVELLARVVGEEGGRPVYAARPLVEPSGDMTEWRWTIGERGEVTLQRGADEDAARFPIAVTLASRTGETSVARRDSCPSR